MTDVLLFPNAREQQEWGCSRRDTGQERPCTGTPCAFSSRAQTPASEWHNPWPRQGSGLAGSIRVQSGVAGCGAGDKRLCPLLIYSFKCHQSHLLTNPTLQRGQGPSSRFSPVPGQLFCSCLWSDCRRSVCVWTWWGCARLWIQPTEPRRCLLLVGLRRLSSHGLYWNGLSCLPKAGAEKNRACSCLAHWCLLIMPLQPSLCLNCLCASTDKHITFFSQSMVIN